MATDISFSDSGKLIKTYPLSQMKKIFKVYDIEVYDQVVHKNKKYKAFKTSEVFEKIYGSKWKNRDEMEFTCADGYKPSFDSSYLLRGDSYLAFSYQDQKSFTTDLKSHNKKDVEMGPLYLVWKAKKGSFIYNKKDSIWPYQLVSFDFISFKTKFPSLYPKTLQRKWKKDLRYSKKLVLSAHSINKVGGTLALILYIQIELLITLKKKTNEVENPQTFRYNSKMPL